ncbi:hypothetical protein D3C71_234420 [compost metagenome]
MFISMYVSIEAIKHMMHGKKFIGTNNQTIPTLTLIQVPKEMIEEIIEYHTRTDFVVKEAK